MKRLLRLLNLRDESGAALVITAIAMVALLGFTALAIDGGRLYLEKSKLQKAMDAAVLAGAHKLLLVDSNESVDQAKVVAKDISQKNGYSLLNTDIEAIHKTHIKATKQVDVPLTFAKAIGINTATISASAKAIVAGSLNSTHGIAPIAIEKSAVPNKTILTCGEEENESGKKSPGNCGFIRIDGSGAPFIEEGIKNGSKTIVSEGDKVYPEPGVMNGPVDKAVESSIDSIINSDKDKPHCQSAATADNTCKRVIYVAIINSWDGINGSSKPVEIIGFVPFWVKEYDNEGNQKNIKGQFITVVNSGETGGSEYGLYGVKLAE
jgi:Flp pilus assembly protein TadG